jgi:serine/threonine protein kinase
MNTIYCLNPDCLHLNPDNFTSCQQCGSKLILTERYIPRSILGQGGFGRTFLATDKYKPSQPFCVIKQFLPQAQGTSTFDKASELFAQEAQRLEELGKHLQIPDLMAYFVVDNRQYLVQEFVDGNNLQAELDQNGVFSEPQIRTLLLETLQILEFVHSKQVIHRDIKPENIIRRSSDNKLFLVDFGAAKAVKPQRRTAAGTIIGSAEYCAPEQSMGKPLFISDLYSLGVTCLYLLTQVSPFDLYSPLEGEWLWRDHLNGNVVSDELGQILEKLAHPIAKHRYQSAAEVINALNPGGHSVTQSPTTVPPVPTPSVTLPSQYQKLERFLTDGEWKKADEETFRVMLAVAKREKEDWLDEESIENFPCEDLRLIDGLWIKHSNGRFGFSLQKRIYQSLGGSREYNSKIWEAFGERLGWIKKGWGRTRGIKGWLYYSDITFNYDAPEAHLPCRCHFMWTFKELEDGRIVLGGWGLLSRVETCIKETQRVTHSSPTVIK